MSKTDFRLGTTTHEITIDETTNFDLELIAGIEYYQQKVKIALLFFLGEWFLDTEYGVDWWGSILVQNPNLVNVDNLLKITITEIEGISTEFTEWRSDFDIVNKTLNISFIIDTDSGELNFNEGLQIV